MVAPHWNTRGEAAPVPRRGVSFAWTAVGQEGNLTVGSPVDLSDRSLELRTVVDQRFPRAGLRVRLTDDSGATALVTPVGGGTLPRVPRGESGQWWAQTLAVDPAGAAIDLTKVTGISLVSTTGTGRVVVLDASATPDTLAAVPDERAAQVSFGSAVVDEGDGPGEATVSIPVTVTGTLSTPATVRVVTFGETVDTSWRTLTLEPGETSTSLDFTYTPDDLFGGDSQFAAAGYVGQGIITDAYTGLVRVREDDPLPGLSVKAVRSTVTEGQKVVLRVKMDKKMATWADIDAGFVKSSGRYLKVNDVRLPRHRYYRGRDPLWKHPEYVYSRVLKPGRTSFEITMPTVRDRIKERTEKAKFRFRLRGPDGQVVIQYVVVRVKNR